MEHLGHISTKTSQMDSDFNPFPGLRPFGVDESHLFFGREGQSDEVLKKLAENHFVAVIGASGSGKSSLMYCGLIPILYGGFIAKAGSRWSVVTSRPGSSPIDNLSKALVNDLAEEGLADEEKNIREKITNSVLRSSSMGLVDAIKQLVPRQDQNILILADQFEELFRFKKNTKKKNSQDESVAFVKLLVEAANQLDNSIYVVLTMRSDFLGDCAQFPALTEKINYSHYLIPQMTRENLKDVIVGPVAVGGGEISSELTHELLNSVGDNPDQLPILQHSLMRTWDYWKKHYKKGEPMDLVHYDAIGRMENALSKHANEAYDELTQEQKALCARLFKSLTERTGDNRGIRHPSSVGELMAISGASFNEVIEVLNRFRVQGRSFLTPRIGTEVTEKSIIDISHESLMRVWDQLKTWVDEEANSIQLYTRLCQAAAMYQVGKASLWRPPDLQIALNWRNLQNPNLAWAQRFDPAFERAMVFLNTSQKEYEAEELHKILQQKKELKRTRVFAGILGGATILSLGMMIYTITLSQKAEQSAKEANELRVIAEQNAQEANSQKIRAEKALAEAEKQKEKAEKQQQIAEQNAINANVQRERAEKALAQAERQRILTVQALTDANVQRERAEQALQDAEVQRQIAEQNANEARINAALADTARKDAQNLRMLSIAQSMAVKSQQVKTDPQKKALIAYQAYDFNNKFGGDAHHGDIYNGLYYALKEFKEDEFNVYEGHRQAVRSIIATNSGELFSAGSEGVIFKWDMGTKEPQEIAKKKAVFIDMKMSQDEKYLACAQQNGDIYLHNLQDNNGQTLKGNGQRVNSLLFKDNQLFSTGRDGVISQWNLDTGEPTTYVDLEEIVRTMAYHDGKMAIGTHSGKIYIVDEQKNKTLLSEDNLNAVWALDFHPNGTQLVSGDKKGNVKVWDLQKMELETDLEGHQSRVHNITYSQDGSMLASVSLDGSVRVWKTDALNKQALFFTDHEEWVVSLAFNPTGKKIYVGTMSKVMKVWDSDTEDMAVQLRDLIERNMTEKEWSRYVAEDIDYEKTKKELQ
ncbi:MAG: hypothetical protein GY827_06635 [Cytophagales bacterium]|nr:hypothetical protein [Cytophagales bacterium]